jgi:hypothetical protein
MMYEHKRLRSKVHYDQIYLLRGGGMVFKGQLLSGGTGHTKLHWEVRRGGRTTA